MNQLRGVLPSREALHETLTLTPPNTLRLLSLRTAKTLQLLSKLLPCFDADGLSSGTDALGGTERSTHHDAPSNG